MQIVTTIVAWILLWLGGWSGWIFLIKKGINHIKMYRIASVYFLLLSFLSFRLYHDRLNIFFSHLPIEIVPFYFLIFFFATIFSVYYLSRKIFDKELLSSHINKKVFAAVMDYRFIIAKSCDIFFQQLLILSLIISLQQVILNTFFVIIISGVVFGLVHIPLLLIKYNSLAIYFVLAAFFAGALFSFLTLSLPYGFMYSYMVHWSFYILVGITYNIRIKRKDKIYQTRKIV